MSNDWPLYEVFIRSRSGLEHKHVGSLHAVDARQAVEHARDVYTRRQEDVSIWVVKSSEITASVAITAAPSRPALRRLRRRSTWWTCSGVGRRPSRAVSAAG